MNQLEAQGVLKAEMIANPQNIIDVAIRINPKARIIFDDVKNVPGPISGLAAITLKAALRGGSNEETITNMIRFAELLKGETKCLAQ